MTSSMGMKGWKETWSGRGRRRSSTDQTKVGSEVSSLTDYSLERSHTHDTAPFLLREPSTLSSNVDTTNYQEKLQDWSTVFQDAAVLAPRPGTSLNNTRPLDTRGDIEREISFLQANRSAAFPVKPRELYDPVHNLVPSHNNFISQRKYYVLPSIGNQNDFILRRQHSNVETLNQLDYARDNYEDDVKFFAELSELKRESSYMCSTPHPQSSQSHPLPPIQRLKDVVRPRTNIAELDEDHYAFSGRTSSSAMSVISDVEQFRGMTPEPDYADTSPRKASISSQVMVNTGDVRNKSVSDTSANVVDQTDLRSSVPATDADHCNNVQSALSE